MASFMLTYWGPTGLTPDGAAGGRSVAASGPDLSAEKLGMSGWCPEGYSTITYVTE